MSQTGRSIEFPQSFMTLKDIRNPATPARSATLPNTTTTTTPLREDEMDDSTTVAVPGSSVHDHEGWRAKAAHTVADIFKDESLSKAQIKQKMLAAVKMLDDDVEGDVGAAADAGAAAADADASAADDDAGAVAADTDTEKPDEEETDAEPEMPEEVRALKNSSDPKDKELYENVLAALKEDRKTARQQDRLKAREAYQGKRTLARKLCMESKLKDFKGSITTEFVEELAELSSEARMKAKIQDRLSVLSVTRPISTAGRIGGGVAGGDMDAKAFAAHVNG